MTLTKPPQSLPHHKLIAYQLALACAAVEIAGALGACSPADVDALPALGVRLKDVLSRLIR